MGARSVYLDINWGIKMNTKRDIPYLHGTMYYFVRHTDNNVIHEDYRPLYEDLPRFSKICPKATTNVSEQLSRMSEDCRIL